MNKRKKPETKRHSPLKRAHISDLRHSRENEQSSHISRAAQIDRPYHVSLPLIVLSESMFSFSQPSRKAEHY